MHVSYEFQLVLYQNYHVCYFLTQRLLCIDIKTQHFEDKLWEETVDHEVPFKLKVIVPIQSLIPIFLKYFKQNADLVP